MTKKIKEAADSIKSKLSFENYTPSSPNSGKTEKHKDIKTEEPKNIKTETPKKLKRTFYILESVLNDFDAYYAKCLVNQKKVDKGDIVTQAIKNLLEDKDAEVGIF